MIIDKPQRNLIDGSVSLSAKEDSETLKNKFARYTFVWMAWTIYALIETAVNVYHEGMPFLESFAEHLIQFYLCALLILPFWWVIKRFVWHWHWVWQALFHLIGAPLFVVAWYSLYLEIYPILMGSKLAYLTRYWLYLLEDALRMYLACNGFFYVWVYSQQMARRRRAQMQAELLANRMELLLLKSRLNPHFLFNALNTVNGLVKTDPDLARSVIASLGESLRYALDSDQKTYVPLFEEMNFVDAYIAIARARWADKIEVRRQYEDEVLTKRIPPMTIQPLVENVIEHAVSNQEATVLMQIEARLTDGFVEIWIRDNGTKSQGKTAAALLERGQGLSDTNKRLNILFGTQSQLKFETETGFSVGFKFPADTAIEEDEMDSQA